MRTLLGIAGAGCIALAAPVAALAADEVDESKQLAVLAKLIEALEAGDEDGAAKKISSIENLYDVEDQLARTPREFTARLAGCKASTPTKRNSHSLMHTVEWVCDDGKFTTVLDAGWRYPYVTVGSFESDAMVQARKASYKGPPPAPPPAPFLGKQRQPTEAEVKAMRDQAQQALDSFGAFVVAGARGTPVPAALASFGRVETGRRHVIHKVTLNEEKGRGLAALAEQVDGLSSKVGKINGYDCTASEFIGRYLGHCKFALERSDAILIATVYPSNGGIVAAEFIYTTQASAMADFSDATDEEQVAYLQDVGKGQE